jgi:hypothetical protein
VAEHNNRSKVRWWEWAWEPDRRSSMKHYGLGRHFLYLLAEWIDQDEGRVMVMGRGLRARGGDARVRAGRSGAWCSLWMSTLHVYRVVEKCEVDPNFIKSIKQPKRCFTDGCF